MPVAGTADVGGLECGRRRRVDELWDQREVHYRGFLVEHVRDEARAEWRGHHQQADLVGRCPNRFLRPAAYAGSRTGWAADGYRDVVAAFDPNDSLSGDPAFRLVENTFVTMFWSEDLFVETLGWLTQLGYEIVDVDAGSSADADDLLDALFVALGHPAYVGRNLAEFDDCMIDIVTGYYGSDLAATGFVLALRNYDAFVCRDAAFAHRILDIVAKQCRSGALIGHRMMCLVQSNDPDLVIPPVGATPVVWNDAEWLDTRRRGEGVDTPTVKASRPSVGSSTGTQHNRCAAGKPRAVSIGSVLVAALAAIPRAHGRLLSWSAAQRRRW